MLHEVKKINRFIDFIEKESLALEYTPADQKSLYRRASAFEHLGKLNEAISDAQRLISISPKESSADEQTNVLLRKLRENAQNKVHTNIFLLFYFHSNFLLAYSTNTISITNSTNVRSD
jgi:tetratricopeptide (TPR) repeat protein